jgi:O-acetyl-ADP-ribose deacetylase (regulator of RNase III)
MLLELYKGAIHDLQVAKVLVCSANVSLNMSGGVGGALLSRYGSKLQVELHSHFSTQGPRFVRLGDVIVTHPTGTPYKPVLHAVTVEAARNCVKEIARFQRRSSGSLALTLTGVITCA